MTELLLGCGHQRRKLAAIPGEPCEWQDVVTLDYNADCKPDLICDLRTEYWHCRPLTDRGLEAVIAPKMQSSMLPNYFHEVHAYEVLEHLGVQGDIRSFFSTFDNIWRILVPDGYLFASCPSLDSRWLWSDPGHTRVISAESLVFLDQEEYHKQLGKTAMSDYRHIWKGDFKTIHSQDDGSTHLFVLKAIKPARTF